MTAFEVIGNPKNLALIHKFLYKNLTNLKIDKDLIENIIISVDEACANIVHHNYKKVNNKKIRIVLEKTSSDLIIDIYDEGKKFNILKYRLKGGLKEINWFKMKKRGFGIFLIMKLTDKVEWEYKKGIGNHLRLIYRLKL